jgi:hypothetical protein
MYVCTQREELESLRHQNEMARLDAVRGAREARVGVNASTAQEVRRLQDQAELYLQRIQVRIALDWWCVARP